MANKSKTLHTSGRWALLTFRRVSLALGICALLALSSSLAGPPRPGMAAGPGAVSAGGAHTCAVTGIAMISGGGVQCWGFNIDGQVGDGTTTDRATPVGVVGLASGVAGVSAGEQHTCAVTTGGGVKCWGWNHDGQLGNGSSTGPEICYGGNPCSRTPVAVSGLADALHVVAGNFHTCAITSNRGVKCWGSDWAGQLGGTAGDVCNGAPCATVPIDVDGLTTGVDQVAAGALHTCALSTSGGVKCWGSNASGQLGDGTTTNRPAPVDVVGLTSGVDAISAGGSHTCAVTAGGVKCWGRNELGQLGNGTTVASSTPLGVCNGGKSAPCGSNVLSGATAVSAGLEHTCALMVGGGVKCWGSNGFGGLGGASAEDCDPDPDPANVSPCSTTPVDGFGLSSGAGGVSAGDYHTCALASGGVKCWGWGVLGQLGNGTVTGSETPVDVLMDNDMDGCLDSDEVQTEPEPGIEASGGLRNPKSFWDFMDQYTGAPPARDRTIAVGDIGAVVGRFGTARPGGAPAKGEALAEALTPPVDGTNYHASADRNGSYPLQDVWDLKPPNGTVSVGDIGAVVAQFGHSCL